MTQALDPSSAALAAPLSAPAAPELEVISPDEARFERGPRHYRVRGLALLRDPGLAERIVRDVEAVGVIGEGVNALVGYLAMVSRLLDRPLAVLIQSTSAAGKSTLMDALLSLLPDGQRVHYSAMTGQSLFYLEIGS